MAYRPVHVLVSSPLLRSRDVNDHMNGRVNVRVARRRPRCSPGRSARRHQRPGGARSPVSHRPHQHPHAAAADLVEVLADGRQRRRKYGASGMSSKPTTLDVARDRPGRPRASRATPRAPSGRWPRTPPSRPRSRAQLPAEVVAGAGAPVADQRRRRLEPAPRASRASHRAVVATRPIGRAGDVPDRRVAEVEQVAGRQRRPGVLIDRDHRDRVSGPASTATSGTPPGMEQRLRAPREAARSRGSVDAVKPERSTPRRPNRDRAP